MKKTFLATAIPAFLFASAASATELYSDEVNTLTVGGHISAGLTGSDEGSTDVESISPRINFGAIRDLGNGFTADALVEWSINMTGGEQALSTRLGYIGLTHDEYGRVAAGTQWAPTYDITGVADLPIAFANDSLYNNMNLGGTRADNMVSYRNSHEFDNNISVNLGLGAQSSQNVENHEFNNGIRETEKTDYSSRYQAALSVDIAEYSVGVAYNTGDVAFDGAAADTVALFNAAAKYGTYGQGFYAAAGYGTVDYDAYNDKETNYDALVSYGFANSVNVSLNYEETEYKGDGEKYTDRKETAIQVEYNFLSNVMGYAGYQIDLNNEDNHDKDNVWAIGARIYL